MNPFRKKDDNETSRSEDENATGQVIVPTLSESDKAIGKIDAILDASEKDATVPTLTEDELKSEIRDLEKRIGKKQEHINKLNTELATMTDELKGLKKQRIELLRRELEA